MEMMMSIKAAMVPLSLLLFSILFGCTVKFEEGDTAIDDSTEISPDMSEDGGDEATEVAPDVVDAPDADIQDSQEPDVMDMPDGCIPGTTLTGMVQISAGARHTCARLGSGGVMCWGDNAFGQLGDGTHFDRLFPVGVVGLEGLEEGAVSVEAGGRHTCALMEGGGVRCWGDGTKGQLGNGGEVSYPEPRQVTGLGGGVSGITLGGEHACAFLDGGAVRCWGSNEKGQLGNGQPGGIQSTPIELPALTEGVTAIEAGWEHTCALLASGTVCWGYNNTGQLGTGDTTDSNVPQAVSGGLIAAYITAGGASAAGHTCALAGSSPMCWGDNTYGQIGDASGLEQDAPVSTRVLSEGVTRISAGGLHTCAITDNDLFCWGNNEYGQLGNGATEGSPEPILIPSPGVSSVSLGLNHTCVLLPDGTASCWGLNGDGQLGDGTTTERHGPTSVLCGSNPDG